MLARADPHTPPSRGCSIDSNSHQDYLPEINFLQLIQIISFNEGNKWSKRWIKYIRFSVWKFSIQRLNRFLHQRIAKIRSQNIEIYFASIKRNIFRSKSISSSLNWISEEVKEFIFTKIREEKYRKQTKLQRFLPYISHSSKWSSISW